MSTEPRRTIVDGIDLHAALPFVRILRTIAMAMQPACLVMGLLMVSALMTAGRAWDALTDPTISPAGLLAGRVTEADRTALAAGPAQVLAQYGQTVSEPIELDDARNRLAELHRARREALTGDDQVAEDARYRQALRTLDDVRPRGAFEATVLHASAAFKQVVAGVLQLDVGAVGEGLARLFWHMPVALWRHERAFLILYTVIVVIVFALGGGAVARLAACEWAGQARARLGAGLDFAIARLATLVSALLLPLVMALIAAVVIGIPGLLLRLPVLDVVAALLYGPMLVLGVCLALLLVGYLAGFALLVPAVVCEDCDAADAQQRAFAYVLNRPLHLLGYAAVALLGLAVGYLVVALVLTIALNSVAALYGLAAGGSAALGEAGGFAVLDLSPRVAATSSEGTAGAAAVVIDFWQTLITSLAPAYVLSYFFCCTSLIYLLLRRACDGRDPAEICPAERRATTLPDDV